MLLFRTSVRSRTTTRISSGSPSRAFSSREGPSMAWAIRATCRMTISCCALRQRTRSSCLESGSRSSTCRALALFYVERAHTLSEHRHTCGVLPVGQCHLRAQPAQRRSLTRNRGSDGRVRCTRVRSDKRRRGRGRRVLCPVVAPFLKTLIHDPMDPSSRIILERLHVAHWAVQATADR